MSCRQDIIFSIKIKNGIPGNNQRDLNWKCLTSRKTLSSCYWNLWCPIRPTPFPLGPRMGPQDTTPMTKIENVWQAEKPCQVFTEFDEAPSGHRFSSGAQDGIPRGNRTERTQKCVTSSKHLVKLLMEFMRFYQDSTFSIRTQDGAPRNSYRNEAWKCLAGEQTLSGFIWFYEIPLEYRFFH